MRCNRGKSTWTLSDCAWKAAKRSVMVWKRWRTASRWSSPLRSPKSRRLFEQSSLRRKAREFLVLFQERILPVRSEDVMSMLDLVDDSGQLSTESLVQAYTKDLADPVGGQTPQADLAAALEDLVDGIVPRRSREVTRLCSNRVT